jgi:di/tricarboxylate transporter
MTAVVGMVAIVLVLYVGLVDRPGEPSGEISLKYGWYLAVLACALITVGGALRASGTERPRKPPGVL